MFDKDKIISEINLLFKRYEVQFRNFFKETLRAYFFRDIVYDENDLLGEYYLYIMNHLFIFVDDKGEINLKKIFNFPLTKQFQNHLRSVWNIEAEAKTIDALKREKLAQRLRRNITRESHKYR